MTVVKQPEVTLNIQPANTISQVEDIKVLFVGQQTSNGSATAGTLVENIGNQAQEDDLFGADSHLARMIRAAKRKNKVTRFDAIPLDDDGGATQATADVTFTGTATADGTIFVTVGSYEQNRYEVTVSSGDAATDVGDALVTAIGNDNNAFVTAANATGTVTLTAINGGTIGNEIGLKVEGTVAGVTTSLSGAFSSGATDPDLTNLFDVIEGDRYQIIVWPSTYDIDTVKDFLDDRFNVTNGVLDGRAILTQTDTLSNLQTEGNNHNSQSLVIFGDKVISESLWEGPAMLEYNDTKTAYFAAISALRLTEGANISDLIVANNGGLDQFGGPALASFPYFNTPIPELPLIPTGYGWTRTEIEQLSDSGISVMGNNRTRTNVLVGEVVTTYKTDAAGNDDPSFKYLNYVETMSVIREFFDVNLRDRFVQTRLTDGDLVPRRNIANEALIASYLDQLYQILASNEYVLVRDGSDAFAFFKNNRTITLDLQAGQVSVDMQTPIVTQLREIIGNIQLAFEI